MTEDIIIRAVGALLAGFILWVLSRWATKLTKALDDQMVVNVQTAGALALLNEKIAGHERMTEVRYDHLSDRMGNLERDVAHRGHGA